MKIFCLGRLGYICIVAGKEVQGEGAPYTGLVRTVCVGVRACVDCSQWRMQGKTRKEKYDTAMKTEESKLDY